MHAEITPLEFVRLRAIFEPAPIGIDNIGADGRFLHAKPTLLRFLGYPLATLQSLTFSDSVFAEVVRWGASSLCWRSAIVARMVNLFGSGSPVAR